MILSYKDINGNQEKLAIKSIDFLHFAQMAIVVDTDGISYKLSISSILRVEQ